MRTLQIFIDEPGTDVQVAADVGRALGLELIGNADGKGLTWFEHFDSRRQLLLFKNDLEDEVEMPLSQYSHYMRIVAQREHLDEIGRELFDALKADGRMPIMLVDDLNYRVDSYEPSPGAAPEQSQHP
jgi:hypothetical protein